MSRPIERVTMFKIHKQDDRETVLAEVRNMKRIAVKDGKPYILTCEAGHVMDDPRTQGWTLVNKTTFASLDDMVYYDKSCEAHQKLKTLLKPMLDDVMTVYYESATRGGNEKL